MKRVLVVLEDKEYKAIKKIKKQNYHTWNQVLWAYADAYKKKEK